MKGINFINSIPPRQQQEFARWYRISMMLCSIFFAIVLLTNAYQWYRIVSLQYALPSNQNEHSTAALNEYTELQQAIAAHQKKIALIGQQYAMIKQPTTVTSTLLALLAENKKDLVGCSVSHEQLEATLNVAGTATATNFLNKLHNTKLFDTLHIASITPITGQNAGMICTLSGVLAPHYKIALDLPAREQVEQP